MTRWRTLDIVTVAVLAVVSGVVFWAWNLLWNATGPVFAAFPPAQALMYGVWLVPGVLGMLMVRLPGAAVATAFLAAAVSWLLGAWWGLSVLWYGVLQGLAPELVFAAGRYRRFGRRVASLRARRPARSRASSTRSSGTRSGPPAGRSSTCLPAWFLGAHRRAGGMRWPAGWPGPACSTLPDRPGAGRRLSLSDLSGSGGHR